MTDGKAKIATRGLNSTHPTPKTLAPIVLGRRQISRNLSRHLPYYLTPEEAHNLIESCDNERNQLFLTISSTASVAS